jgi:predicted dithiol-disulfide oxidoreductase (DUF899 family)
MAKMDHPIVSREEWNSVRQDLLQKEKELTHRHDALAAEIRSLPWVKITKQYIFQTTDGPKTLLALFEGHSQLFVYHFMFGVGWKSGCPMCSLWADNYGGMPIHLSHRDCSFKVVSSAPLKEILAYKERMGWEFDWVSAAGSEFNYDLEVSLKDGQTFPRIGCEERSGISCFYRDAEDVYHTYFTSGRVKILLVEARLIDLGNRAA